MNADPPAPPRAPHVRRLQDAPAIRTRDYSGHPTGGGRHWVLVDAETAGSREFAFGVFRLEPGEYHPRHYHHHAAEIYYVTEGTARITVGVEEVDAGAGTSIYLPPGTVHAVRPGEGGVTLLWTYDIADMQAIATRYLE